jgi:predicted  nucleic acid-binding Zn-ribbon protein
MSGLQQIKIIMLNILSLYCIKMNTTYTRFGNNISLTKYKMSTEQKNVGITSLNKMFNTLDESIKLIKEECTELANEIVALEGQMKTLNQSIKTHDSTINAHDEKIQSIING